jgi:hypothetical protein
MPLDCYSIAVKAFRFPRLPNNHISQVGFFWYQGSVFNQHLHALSQQAYDEQLLSTRAVPTLLVWKWNEARKPRRALSGSKPHSKMVYKYGPQHITWCTSIYTASWTSTRELSFAVGTCPLPSIAAWMELSALVSGPSFHLCQVKISEPRQCWK